MRPKQRIRFQATGELGEKTHSEYDDLDRLTARLEPDLKSYWVFDTATYGKGKLTEAYTLSGTVKDYRRVHTYDAIGRPGKTTQTLTDGTYTSTQAYDAWGRVISQSYQRNADPAKQFDSRYHNGYLARVERGSLVLWKVNAQDAGNRPTSVALGNGLTQSRDFNRHMAQMTSGALSTAGNVARLQEGYDYDPLNNVVWRQQFWDQGGFQESFTYDALNRLETSTVQGRTAQTFRYDAAGNLLSKTGVGTGNYAYPAQGATAVRPHAVQSIPGIGGFVYDDNGNLTSGNGRTMSWTSFDMPLTITGGGVSATFVYGPEHQRIRQTRGDGSSVVYAGAQEVEKNASGTTVKTYWPGGIGVEIDRPGATVSELYWHHLDRLGSVIGLTDQQGVLKEKLGYDAWGKRRTIDGASTPNNLDGQVDNRGFTGHEMLDQLDLVHMNGRVYDPLVARFVSGDPLIQDPVDGQNYNRYSYVLNNPTNHTDPSGFACGEAQTGSKIKESCSSFEKAAEKCTEACYAGTKNKDGTFTAKAYGDGKGNASKLDANFTFKVDAKNQGNIKSANTSPSKSACDPGVQCVVVAGKRAASNAVEAWAEWSSSNPLIVQGAKGVLKAGLGGISVAGGAGLCSTGVGCVAGGPVAAIGASELTQGTTMLWDAVHGVVSNGFNPLKTVSNAALGQYGDLAYDSAALAANIGALASKVPLVLGTADGLNRAKSIFDVTVTQWRNAKYIPGIGLYIPPIANKAGAVISGAMAGQRINDDVKNLDQ